MLCNPDLEENEQDIERLGSAKRMVWTPLQRSQLLVQVGECFLDDGRGSRGPSGHLLAGWLCDYVPSPYLKKYDKEKSKTFSQRPGLRYLS